MSDIGRHKSRQSQSEDFSSIVFSFDVFDTAITRAILRPDHLHWLVGLELMRSGHLNVGERTWRQVRIQAEQDARTAANGREVTLDDIYSQVSNKLGLPETVIRAAINFEREAEGRLSSPITVTKNEWYGYKQSGNRCIFLSDFYLDKEGVLELLSAAGYDPSCEDVFVSSFYGDTKANGSLYTRVHELLDPVEISCHIGDNKLSDVEMAERHGIRARHFHASAATRREVGLYKSAGKNYLSSLISGAARAARLSSPQPEAVVVQTASSVAAPALTAFVLWVVLEAREKGIQRLYFLARDGQVLRRLGQIVSDWVGVSLDCRYLLGSRLAFHLPALQDDPVGIITEALERYPNSPEECLVELGFSTARREEILTRAGMERGSKHYGEIIANMRRILAEQACLKELTESINSKRAALEAYLQNVNFFDGTPKAIVDLGWAGNLQNRLERITHSRLPGGIDGFYYALNPSSKLKGRVAAFQDEMPIGSLLETFCLANHTSITGFQFNANGMPEAVGGAPDRAGIEWGVQLQQDCIVKFAECFFRGTDARLFDPYKVLSVLKRASSLQLDRFQLLPTASEAEVYGGYRHAEGQTHFISTDLAARLSSVQILYALISKKYRRRITHWKSGTIVRSRFSLVGFFLYALLRCGGSGLWLTLRLFTPKKL